MPRIRVTTVKNPCSGKCKLWVASLHISLQDSEVHCWGYALTSFGPSHYKGLSRSKPDDSAPRCTPLLLWRSCTLFESTPCRLWRGTRGDQPRQGPGRLPAAILSKKIMPKEVDFLWVRSMQDLYFQLALFRKRSNLQTFAPLLIRLVQASIT